MSNDVFRINCIGPIGSQIHKSFRFNINCIKSPDVTSSDFTSSDVTAGHCTDKVTYLFIDVILQPCSIS